MIWNKPYAMPPGFGVRQPSGAFGAARPIAKRQGTAAVQDAGTWKPTL